MHFVDTFYRFIDVFSLILLLTPFFLYICVPMMIQNKRILASILFVLISFVCVAQGDGNLPPPPQPPPPVGLPIDGGIFVGLLVAVFYGGKKLMKK